MKLVPKWETARAYVIQSSDHKQFFLKIYSNDNVPESAFRFAFDLFAKAGITHVAHPIPTSDDQMRIQIGDFHVALFNLIPGKTAQEQKLTERQLETLGELLAKIHQSKAIVGEYSVKENFAIPFKRRVAAIFNAMSQITANSTKYKKQLRLLLEPYRQHFLQELETLEKLQHKVRQRHLAFVNCHGEPSPGNILSSGTGEIHLLDWDEPVFAPKEKDLLFFNDRIGPVMKGYTRFSQDNIVNRDVIQFYGHMWNLGEIAYYGSKILFEKHSGEQNQIWLDNLKGGWDFTF